MPLNSGHLRQSAAGDTLPTPDVEAPRRHARRRLAHLSPLDALGIAVAAAALLAGSLVAHVRVPYFWYDELATWTLVSDPSLASMLRAIRHGAESNPPLYEMVLWLWSAVAGHGELSLRLATALFMTAAMAVLWRTLRMGYAVAPTALGIAVAFFGGQVILEQLAQARFYGLFAFCTSVAIGLAVEASRRPDPGARLLAATLGAHLALVYSHVFGGFFSAAILAALVLADVRRGRFRPWLYGAISLAWVFFLPWVPAVLEQRTLGEGRSWLARPTRDDFFAVVGRQILWLPLAIATVVLASILGGEPGRREAVAPTDRTSARITLVLIAVCLLAVLPAVFLLSRVVVPVFLDRYLLPGAFGWAIIVAHVASRLSIASDTGDSRRNWYRSPVDAASALLFCALALYPTVFALARPRAARPDVRVDAGLADLPVVVESGHQFWPLRRYAGAGGDRYRYLLDEEIAGDSANAPGAAQEQQLMQLYARLGYLGRSVEGGPRFLCGNERFIVIDSPAFTWFERRVRDSEAYRWNTVGGYLGSAVRLVERTAPCADVDRTG